MSKKLKIVEEENLWYSQGLKFKCTECGRCCTGAPGYVWVNEEDIEKIALHLNLEKKEFYKRYLRVVGDKVSLREDAKNFDCIFLKDKKCSIYEHRPTQCRTFPWWPNLLKTPADWEDASKYCEGIHRDAPLVSFETIEKERLKQEKA